MIIRRGSPYRFEISFVAGLVEGDEDAMIDWAIRRLESLPGVYVQGASAERMQAGDVVEGSPLDVFLKGPGNAYVRDGGRQ